MEWTAVGLLKWATEDFQTRGLDGPRRSAEVLLSSALNTDRVGLYLQYDRPISSEERDRFRALVEKRRQGTPVAYLMGEKEFYSMPLRVDERVLIPRPETELLVDEALQVIADQSWKVPRICDVGTGSGAIALALKKSLPQAHVMATDISSDALGLAKENAKSLELEVNFVSSDLLQDVDGIFHLITANLPYIRQDDMAQLSHEVREFEPSRALVAGGDGLKYIRSLIESAKSHLDDGYLLLEIGEGQAQDVSTLLTEQAYEIEAIREDLAGIPRVVIARQRKA